MVVVLREYATAAYFAYCRIFFAYFSNVRISHIFSHKLTFSTAILILFMFLLPIFIGFRYLDHLIVDLRPVDRSWIGGSTFRSVDLLTCVLWIVDRFLRHTRVVHGLG